MARVLIVGCGCRGQALAASLSDHAVRGTSRSPERVGELGAAGIEGVVADPDRLGTLVPALAGVSVVCWLMGTALGSPELHGERLQTFVEHLVDTPVRGLVYEAGGTVAPKLLEQGAEIVLGGSRVWHIRGEVVSADPAALPDWLEAMTAAIDRILSA